MRDKRLDLVVSLCGLCGLSVPALFEKIVMDTLVAGLDRSFWDVIKLTAPLTFGVAVVAFAWFAGFFQKQIGWHTLFFVAGVLLVTAYLGKVFAIGVTPTPAALEAARGSANESLWALSQYRSGGGSFVHWTFAAVALVAGYLVLYGPLQFCISLAAGGVIGWNWAHALASLEHREREDG